MLRKRFRPRPRWRPLYAAGCRRGRMPDASLDTRHLMVQRITQAPPPRLTTTYFQATNGLSSLCASSPSPSGPLAFATVAFGSVLLVVLLAVFLVLLLASLLAFALLALPFAAPAFLGLAAFGSAIGSATSLTSTGWVGLGRTGSGSGRSCAGSSLLKATPSSRKPAPDGSVATTPSGSPSSFQASAASSSSHPCRLLSPAMIASAIRPAFWRTAASILAATSGFSLRNCLAFSRPCPMRWLS